MRYIVTLWGSRFDRYKVPSGTIEDSDIRSDDDSNILGAARAMFRELEEETKITPDALQMVGKLPIEDVIREGLRRYYFFGVTRSKMPILPFRSQEQGVRHYVHHQSWTLVRDVVRGKSFGDHFNTRYSLALARSLVAMQSMSEFRGNISFSALIQELISQHMDLHQVIGELTERQAREDEERRLARTKCHRV
jgi:hypothetical protein